MTIDEVFYNHHKKYGNNRPDVLREAVKAYIQGEMERQVGECVKEGKHQHAEMIFWFGNRILGGETK